jgi:preprotein translocase subunit YajC
MIFQAILLQSGVNPQAINIIFIVGMVAILYFFMIRPQQQKQRKQKEFIESISKGDSVITVGGLHGKIYAIEDNTVVIEVDKGVKLRYEKSSLSFENTQAVLGTAEKKNA